MIKIIEKKACCGCGACAQKCPKHCIAMVEDEEGFLYPNVDPTSCIDCGLCNKVCPVQNQSKEHSPINVYAAQNTQENIRRRSSSGGIFYELAQYVLGLNGVVFGVELDSNQVARHCMVENAKDLPRIMTSKYVQSNIGNSYLKVKETLKQNRLVLFSGTPCQVAGLKKFLQHDYGNLIAVEVVCHGAPSPRVWRDYLRYANPTAQKITAINFRDKSFGWRKFSMSISFEDGTHLQEHLGKNIYLQGFLKNLYLRPSCHACPARSGKSGADISLGDFWGISKSIYADDMGTSAVLVNTEKGQDIMKHIHIDSTPVSLDAILKENPCLIHSVPVPARRTLFWEQYNKNGIEGLVATLESMKPKGFHYLISKIKSIVKLILKR